MIRIILSSCVWLALALSLTSAERVAAQTETPVGTAFNYQGRIKLNNSLITGRSDFRFTLFDSLSGGTQVGAQVTILPDQMNLTANNVVNGLFNTALNAGGEFGPNAFDGNARWLQLEVRHPSNPAMGSSGFTPVTPRQELKPAPYAISGGGWVPGLNSTLFNGAIVGIGTNDPATDTDYARLTTSGGQMRIDKYSFGTDSTIDISPIPLDGTNLAYVRFFYGTATTGSRRVVFYRGDGTAGPPIDAQIGIDGDPTFFGISGGNVGIGTSSPADLLHVVLTNSYARFERNIVNAVPQVVINHGNAAGNSVLSFRNQTAVKWDVGSIPAMGDAFVIATPQDERLVITQSGNVGIGTATPTDQASLHVVGPGNNGSNSPLRVSSGEDPGFLLLDENEIDRGGTSGSLTLQGNAAGNLIMCTGGGNVGIGISSPASRLHVDGNVQATCGVLTCSDRRFKTDVEPLRGALAIASALVPVRFRWRTETYPDRSFSDGPQIGFIAQDLQGTLPEVVIEGTDGYLAVDYGRLTPVLVEAVKELHGIVQDKDARIAKQQCEIDDMKSRLSAIEARLAQNANSPIEGGTP